MKKYFSTAAALLGAVLSLHGQAVETGGPDIAVHGRNPRGGTLAPTVGSTGLITPAITAHGGPVMTGVAHAYVIWYGSWNQNNTTDTPAGQQIIRDFLNSIGGSSYLAINTTYPGVSGNVTFAGETSDAYSQGNKLSDKAIQTIVKNALTANKLPKDPSGVYFVLTSSDVNENTGFCTRYCGWHTHAGLVGLDVKYSFVGNAARCLNACAAQTTSPNGNAGVDAMISVIAHELEETNSDPDLNAWYDSTGAENADKCAWTFGNASQDSSGAYYNVSLGARNYLIQRNLAHGVNGANGVGDYCAISYVGGVIGN